MTYSEFSTMLPTRRMTIIFILSLFFGFIAMNIKVIDQPQSEILIDPKPASSQSDNLFSHLFNTKKTSKTDSNNLSIILSDLNPSIPFNDLQIRLHGIVYNGENTSYALISKRGGVQEVYQKESSIFKNTTVKKITKNQVMVNYYDENHVLSLVSESSGRNLLNRNIAEEFNQEDMEQLRVVLEQERRRNPIRLLLIRRPFAVYEKGQFLGYKIMPGGNADQFIRLGFESGDIITGLNGLTFDGPGMQPFIINELTHSLNIDLVVLRGKDQISIMYGFGF